MQQATMYSFDGSKQGVVDLNATYFGRAVNVGLIHRLLLIQRANGRVNVAHTKTRGDVIGSTRKLYKQKKTGNARVGDARSSIRRGGGVAFGPRNTQNFSLMMNKKERRAALLSLLSSKAQGGNVFVLDSLPTDTLKTKDIAQFLSKSEQKSVVFAVTANDQSFFQAGRNIPTAKVISVNYLNPHDLLKFQNIIFTRESLESLPTIFKV